MKVLCVCPTYNRVASNKKLLEEAVESFLQQTYTDSILAIVNDCERQVIHFDHPRVKVFNWCNRACTLGEKYNLAIRMFDTPLVCTWEDDDISLPHRLSYSVKKLGDADYFNPLGNWFLGKELTHEHSQGYCHNSSIYTRKAFEHVGGYDSVTGNQDALMDRKLRKLNAVLYRVPPRDWTYIYRFGVSDLHLSGQANSQDAYDKYSGHAKKSGIFTLRPHFEFNYEKMVRDYIRQHNL